jgi:hypothetical protein
VTPGSYRACRPYRDPCIGLVSCRTYSLTLRTHGAQQAADRGSGSSATIWTASGSGSALSETAAA